MPVGLIQINCRGIFPPHINIAPGQFLKLSDDDQISRPAFETLSAGMRVAATAAHCFGPSSTVGYDWETAFPQLPRANRFDSFLLSKLLVKAVMKASPVAKAARQRGNPYAVAPDPVVLRDAEVREVHRADDLSPATAGDAVTYTLAAEQIESLIAPDEVFEPGAERIEYELLAVGVDG